MPQDIVKDVNAGSASTSRSEGAIIRDNVTSGTASSSACLINHCATR